MNRKEKKKKEREGKVTNGRENREEGEREGGAPDHTGSGDSTRFPCLL